MLRHLTRSQDRADHFSCPENSSSASTLVLLLDCVPDPEHYLGHKRRIKQGCLKMRIQVRNQVRRDCVWDYRYGKGHSRQSVSDSGNCCFPIFHFLFWFWLGELLDPPHPEFFSQWQAADRDLDAVVSGQ